MSPSVAGPAFVACALSCLGPAAANSQSLKVDYAISLAGIPLGYADLATTLEGSKYKMQVGARLTGLAGMLAGGGVSAVEITPPLDEKLDRVPLKESHKRGVLDPVSALLMPAASRGSVTDPGNCNRTLPVFDGAARFDVVLSYEETKQIEKPGYAGPVLVCNARYVPIAGHRALRPSTKFMEDNRDMQVWLAPVQGSRLLVPLRIAVQTMVGMSVIEASQWRLQDAPQLVLPVLPTP